MNIDEIENLEKVLGLDKSQKIVDQKVKRLTAAGDNYGSLMLSLDVTIQTEKREETIRAVAKLVPPNDFIQEMFNTQLTFINEINFYKTIVPTLQQLLQDQGSKKRIDFCPKYYGSKLNDDGKVGKDAALVLENLKVQGFVNMERTVGFDVECSKLILEDLAHLHGFGLALKMLRPEQFDKNVRPYLTELFTDGYDEEKVLVHATRTANQVDETESQYCKEARKSLLASLNKPAREPWATIVHEDCWVNNTMIKFEGGKPVKNKLVDFQICNYASPARDVVFFMFSSVQDELLKKHYDELVDWYYNALIEVLKEMKCDTTQFTRKGLDDEIAYEAKHSQFMHLVMLSAPIMAVKGTVKEIDQLSREDFDKQQPLAGRHKEKLRFIVDEFGRRGWF